jgi:hypothetical protein
MPLSIIQLKPDPIHHLCYQNVAKGNRGVEEVLWPFYEGEADLPFGLDALLLISDLQGVVDGKLMGPAVFKECRRLLPSLGCSPDKAGLILCGDLYSDVTLKERGGTGNVLPVWEAASKGFRWVAGVAGNHDLFGTDAERERFFREGRRSLLDGEIVDYNRLRIAGVCGVIGDPKKPHRRRSGDQQALIRKMIDEKPDLLVLHEGPDHPNVNGRSGHADVRSALEAGPPVTVVCGHCPWPGSEPLTLKNGTRVLNVEGKTLILTRNARGK